MSKPVEAMSKPVEAMSKPVEAIPNMNHHLKKIEEIAALVTTCLTDIADDVADSDDNDARKLHQHCQAMARAWLHNVTVLKVLTAQLILLHNAKEIERRCSKEAPPKDQWRAKAEVQKLMERREMLEDKMQKALGP